jgi:hypothetical protein
MDISSELVDLIVHVTNKAISQIQYSNGPLLSFMTIETGAGGRGEKDFPDGTSDEDIVEVASIEGVQRFALMSSGNMQTDMGQVPVLLCHAAERGDPSGYVLAQRFVPNAESVYGELEGQIDLVQVQQNHFRFAPFRISDDSTRNSVLLQESLVRFAKRMMAQAFGDPDPRVLTVALTALEEESEADGSFSYVHQGTGTHIRVTLVYRNNAFLPVELSQISEGGDATELGDELRNAILGVYQQ